MKQSDKSERRKKISRSVNASRGFLESKAALSCRAVRRNEAFVHEVTKLDAALDSQAALEQMILSCNPPSFVGHLSTSKNIHIDEFLKCVRRWRMECGKLHPRPACPPRDERRFEYLLALEFGTCPHRNERGRLHGHILLWNVGEIPISDLKASWRRIAGSRIGPQIEPYRPKMRGVGYALKTLHTDADLITFSPRLVLRLTNLVHATHRAAGVSHER